MPIKSVRDSPLGPSSKAALSTPGMLSTMSLSNAAVMFEDFVLSPIARKPLVKPESLRVVGSGSQRQRGKAPSS